MMFGASFAAVTSVCPTNRTRRKFVIFRVRSSLSEMRILLRQYLKQLEQSSNVLTELMVFDDMELVLITEIPVETMTLVSGNA